MDSGSAQDRVSSDVRHTTRRIGQYLHGGEAAHSLSPSVHGRASGVIVTQSVLTRRFQCMHTAVTQGANYAVTLQTQASLFSVVRSCDLIGELFSKQHQNDVIRNVYDTFPLAVFR